MSMYKTFQTDDSLEKSGIVIDYGSFRVTIARAGGSNKHFNKVLEQKGRPYRRAILAESISKEIVDNILREAYAEAVVRKWEVATAFDEHGVPTAWTQGIEGPNGDVLPYNKANVIQAFAALPDLFADIQEQASKSALFRTIIQEAQTGN
jgi:hypothetical protein